MTLALRYAARSDRGLIRNNNQDSVYAGPRLLAVADGMGGHAGGEIASNVVISSIAYLDEDRPHDDMIGALRDATFEANEHLRELVAQDRNLDGMGTTLTALLFAGSRIGLVHVGDSRAYLLRGGQLVQITHDDTFVQALVDEGRITEEEASTHPQRSLILRALNGADVDPDLSIREARVGDRYLLCTDGLSGVVSAETLVEALQLPDPSESAGRLVELALRSGGPDNITCIVADVVDVPYGDDNPVLDGAVAGNRSQRDPEPNSPAARAMLARPRPADEDGPGEDGPVRKRRRPLRTAILSLLAVLILGGGLLALWLWTQSQYFVGAQNGQVAIFRGINTAVGPLRLYSVEDLTSLHVTDLAQVAQTRVRSGIPADNRSEADQIVANLASRICRPASTPSPTRTATPSRTPTAKAPPRSPTRPTGKLTTPATPSPSATASPAPAPDQDCP